MQSLRIPRPPWILIALGWVLVSQFRWLFFPVLIMTLYASGVIPGIGLQRGSRQCGGKQEPREISGDRKVDLAKHQPAPEKPASLETLASDPLLPKDLGGQARDLARECAEALTYLRQHGADAKTVFEVEQIRDDFGPQAVRSYLNLVPGTGQTEPVLDGKTGHELVGEQLGLLRESVRSRLIDSGRSGRDDFVANHKFLTEKLGGAAEDPTLRL